MWRLRYGKRSQVPRAPDASFGHLVSGCCIPGTAWRGVTGSPSVCGCPPQHPAPARAAWLTAAADWAPTGAERRVPSRRGGRAAAVRPPLCPPSSTPSAPPLAAAPPASRGNRYSKPAAGVRGQNPGGGAGSAQTTAPAERRRGPWPGRAELRVCLRVRTAAAPTRRKPRHPRRGARQPQPR